MLLIRGINNFDWLKNPKKKTKFVSSFSFSFVVVSGRNRRIPELTPTTPARATLHIGSLHSMGRKKYPKVYKRRIQLTHILRHFYESHYKNCTVYTILDLQVLSNLTAFFIFLLTFFRPTLPSSERASSTPGKFSFVAGVPESKTCLILLLFSNVGGDFCFRPKPTKKSGKKVSTPKCKKGPNVRTCEGTFFGVLKSIWCCMLTVLARNQTSWLVFNVLTKMEVAVHSFLSPLV